MMMQYLRFSLAQQTYAVSMQVIQEITNWTELTTVPNTPAEMCGLLCWRSEVIPVFDFKQRWHETTQKYSFTTVIMVVQIKGRNAGQETSTLMGVILDDFGNTCEADEVEQPADIPAGYAPSSYLQAWIHTQEQHIGVLNLERLFYTHSI